MLKFTKTFSRGRWKYWRVLERRQYSRSYYKVQNQKAVRFCSSPTRLFACFLYSFSALLTGFVCVNVNGFGSWEISPCCVSVVKALGAKPPCGCFNYHQPEIWTTTWHTAKVQVYFPVHCAGVTNVLPRYNLSTAMWICHYHRPTRSSCKKAADL